MAELQTQALPATFNDDLAVVCVSSGDRALYIRGQCVLIAERGDSRQVEDIAGRIADALNEKHAVYNWPEPAHEDWSFNDVIDEISAWYAENKWQKMAKLTGL